MTVALINLLYRILDIYLIAVIVYIILGWLIHFNIVNRSQPFVFKVYEVLFAITDPIMRQIRRVIPPVSGIDLSPIILFLLIYFLQDLLVAFGRSVV